MSSATVDPDLNFCFPIRVLSNDRVKLTPFIPSIYGSTYFNQTSPHPELLAHMPSGPFTTEKGFVDGFIAKVRADPGMIMFAVIDKTKESSEEDEDGPLAGVMCYMNTSSLNLSTEIGYVLTFPSFQRTHVTSNAVGLLLQYALDPPSSGGLGLRRVQWQTNSWNAPSIRAAERMGFEKEGVLRWDRVFHHAVARGKVGNGREMPPWGDKDHLGRDTVLFSLCWDDWEKGAREKVLAIMDRR